MCKYYVGIDPSMRNTGVAIMTADLKPVYMTTLRTGDYKNTVVNDRVRLRFLELMGHFKDFVKDIKDTYKVTPDDCHVFVELPHGSKDANASYSLAFSCCVSAYLDDLGFKVVDKISARDVKIAVTGQPKAEKREIIDLIYSKYPEFNWDLRNNLPMAKNEHQADAVGCILAGLRKSV